MDYNELLVDFFRGVSNNSELMQIEINKDNVNNEVNYIGIAEPVLITACREGRVDIVEYLINIGADVNIICKEFSPLLTCMAGTYAHIDVIQKLLDNGAKPNISCICKLTNKDTRNAILDRLILYGIDLNYDDGYMQSTLLWNILYRISGEEGEYEFLERLLAAGLNVKQNIYPYIPAFIKQHLYTNYNCADIVELLLKYGARFDIPYYYNGTELPLMNIVFNMDDCDVLTLLFLENGLQVDDFIITQIIDKDCDKSIRYLINNNKLKYNQSYILTYNGYDKFYDDEEDYTLKTYTNHCGNKILVSDNIDKIHFINIIAH